MTACTNGRGLARLVHQLVSRYELDVVDPLDEDQPGEGAMSWTEGRRVMLAPLQTNGPALHLALVLVDVIDDDFEVAVSIDTTTTPPVLIGADGQRLDGPADLDAFVVSVERDGLMAFVDDDVDRWLNGGPR